MKAPNCVLLLRALRHRVESSLLLSVGKLEMVALYAAWKATGDHQFLHLALDGLMGNVAILQNVAPQVISEALHGKTLPPDILALPLVSPEVGLFIRKGYKALEAVPATTEYQLESPAILIKELKVACDAAHQADPSIAAFDKSGVPTEGTEEFKQMMEKMMGSDKPIDPSKLN